MLDVRDKLTVLSIIIVVASNFALFIERYVHRIKDLRDKERDKESFRMEQIEHELGIAERELISNDLKHLRELIDELHSKASDFGDTWIVKVVDRLDRFEREIGVNQQRIAVLEAKFDAMLGALDRRKGPRT